MESNMFLMRYRTDMYEWGKGWLDRGKCKRWDDYLNGLVEKGHDHPWTVVGRNSSGDCFRAYSVYSIAYLHPMDGLVYLHNEDEVESFTEFMKRLVWYCGGNVSFKVQNIKYELEV